MLPLVSDAQFDARTLGMRAQKKLLGAMATKKLAKVMIDEAGGRVLDGLHRVVREHTRSRKAADKVVKDLIKVMVKVALLVRNDQLSAGELTEAASLRRRLRQLAMTVVSFHEVDYTYDGAHLGRLLSACVCPLRSLAVAHLSEKSVGRVDRIAAVLTAPALLDDVFRPDDGHRARLAPIVAGLRRLIDDGAL